MVRRGDLTEIDPLLPLATGSSAASETTAAAPSSYAR